MKTILFTLATSTICLVACTAKENIDADKEASKEFVQAALQLNEAKKDIENFNFAQAYKDVVDALNKVDKVVSTYPSSSIALKLVSEENVKIGAFKYDTLKENVEPILRQINNPHLQPISRSWVLASFSPSPNDAFTALAENIENSQTLTIEQKKTITEKIPYLIEKKQKKSEIKSAPQLVKTSNKPKKILSEIEIQLLLKEAEKNAKYCAYELSASEELLKKAENIDAKKYPVFSKILRSALERAKQISVLNLREKSYATLAAAAAKSNDETLSLEIISLIKNPNAFEDVFKSIADSLGKTKNYPAALAIASKIKNTQIKNEFLSKLAKNIAMQNKMQTAVEIAKQINTSIIKNETLCNIAELAYDKKDQKTFIGAISNIDVSSLECLKIFLKYANSDLRNNPSTCGATATLAKMVIPINKKIGAILNNLAIKGGVTNYTTAELIVSNLIALDKFDSAVSFAENEMIKLNNSSLLIAKVAILGAEKNKKEAINILKQQSAKMQKANYLNHKNKISFAFLVETSNLSETEKNDILKPLLNLK